MIQKIMSFTGFLAFVAIAVFVGVSCFVSSYYKSGKWK
jgi:hypothetical protein